MPVLVEDATESLAPAYVQVLDGEATAGAGGLAVHAEHQGPLGRIQAQADQVVDLVDEYRRRDWIGALVCGHG